MVGQGWFRMRRFDAGRFEHVGRMAGLLKGEEYSISLNENERERKSSIQAHHVFGGFLRVLRLDLERLVVEIGLECIVVVIEIALGIDRLEELLKAAAHRIRS